MREQEKEARENAWIEYIQANPSRENFSSSWGFNAGFKAGLDYQQRKLDAYAAYVSGKITLKELEEVLSA